MKYVSMDRKTGKLITDHQHIKQSIEDILTTPFRTRVMRRDYFSETFELIDQPQNAATRLRLMAAIITALTVWEPRVTIKKVEIIEGGLAGKLHVNLTSERNEIFEVRYG